MNSLETLLGWCKNKNIILVGGGPSLDVCEEELQMFSRVDSLFILADVVAENFILKFPKTNRLIFTVENRYHTYLAKILGEKIAVYEGARKNNIKMGQNQIYRFHFDFDSDVEGSFKLKSPGTVMGAALYWALCLAINNQQNQTIHLLGMDLCYLENQVYNRFCKTKGIHKYFNNRETREWLAVLIRTSWGISQTPLIIRTSDEFKRTKEKMETLIRNSKGVEIIDYSPVGLSGQYVKKSIPSKIKSEIIAT